MSYTPALSVLPQSHSRSNIIDEEPESGFWKGYKEPLYLNLVSTRHQLLRDNSAVQ